MEQPNTNIAVGSSDDDKLSLECHKLKLSLPKAEYAGHVLHKYQQIWYHPYSLLPILRFQKFFQANNTDIIIATKPKTGTTWLKSLVFALTNRTLHTNYQEKHPLLTSNPHQLVPFLEFSLYAEKAVPDLTKMDSPRLFATHVGYNSLPDSIKNTDCKIVYINRNPFDTFVSRFHFISSLPPGSNVNLSVEELFDKVCEGVEPYGPFLEHAMGYWKQSLENPNMVLFLNYEDLKKDIVFELKKLADFLGFPFTTEEEKEGVIEEIAQLCSFEKMSNLEVNKNGHSESAQFKKLPHNIYFRKGQVGDWVNYFTPSMMERFNALLEEQAGDSGLSFKVSVEGSNN